MCEGHEVRTVEIARGRRPARPDPAGLSREARAALRVLHAGDDDDQPGAAGRESAEPDRARDPHRDLRRDLPLHGLQEHRRRGPLGRRARSRRSSRRREHGHDRQNLPSATEERPIGFGRLKRKEDARFIRGKGTYLDDIRLPGMVHGAILRSPYAHAKINSIDTSRGARPSGRRRGRHRQGSGDARPGLDADDLLRHAGGAGRRQGPLPGPGGGVRDRHRRVHRARRAAADRRRLRPAPGGRQRAQGARPRRAADPRRQGRARSTTWPAPTWEAGDEEATDRAFAEADIDRHPGHHLPALPPGADGDVRDDRRLQPADRAAGHLQRQPGAARAPDRVRARGRPGRAHDPDHAATTSAAASATRSRSTRATSARSPARSSPACRSSGSRTAPRT